MADGLYEYIIPTGVIVPATSALLDDVGQEYKDAFQRQDLIVTPDTPQGVLITAETLTRVSEVNNNAALANQINPNIAGGVFLDAIMALTGMQRTAQTQSVLTSVAITGQAGTIISVGSRAQTSNGDLFETANDVTLDDSGNATVDFLSVEYGPIPCDADDLTQIVTNILGWETVDNPTAATLGSTTQSDQSARALRNNTLAFQGVSLAEAITSALYAIDGVTSLAFRENVTNDPLVIEGVTLAPHSIYACVKGGTNNNVAAALLENKSSGAGWNGDVVIAVTEPASGQTYSVKFDRPDEIGILIRATVKNGSTQDVKSSIIAYANGELDGEAGFVVGADVSPFEIAGAINRQFPSIYVQKVEISILSPIDYSTDEIEILISQIAVTQNSYITVVQA